MQANFAAAQCAGGRHSTQLELAVMYDFSGGHMQRL